MSVRDLWRRLWRSRSGVAAVEFAYIAPLLIAFTAGAFEVIFMAYDFNLASEATRRGLRTALLQPPIGNLAGVGTTPVVCKVSSGSTTCTGGALTAGTTFTAIVTAMQAIKKDVTANNVQVTYSASGLDNPVTGPGIVTPLISVQLIGVTYQFRLIGVVPGMPSSFPFPGFAAAAVGPSQTS